MRHPKCDPDETGFDAKCPQDGIYTPSKNIETERPAASFFGGAGQENVYMGFYVDLMFTP